MSPNGPSRRQRVQIVLAILNLALMVPVLGRISVNGVDNALFVNIRCQFTRTSRAAPLDNATVNVLGIATVALLIVAMLRYPTAAAGGAASGAETFIFVLKLKT